MPAASSRKDRPPRSSAIHGRCARASSWIASSPPAGWAADQSDRRTPLPTITQLSVRDIRFPTSQTLDGSDAVNRAPDYSATYVVLSTDAGDGNEGHGLTFTTGRGNELCVAAV